MTANDRPLLAPLAVGKPDKVFGKEPVDRRREHVAEQGGGNRRVVLDDKSCIEPLVNDALPRLAMRQKAGDLARRQMKRIPRVVQTRVDDALQVDVGQLVAIDGIDHIDGHGQLTLESRYLGAPPNGPPQMDHDRFDVHGSTSSKADRCKSPCRIGRRIVVGSRAIQVPSWSWPVVGSAGAAGLQGAVDLLHLARLVMEDRARLEWQFWSLTGTHGHCPTS